MEKKLQKINPTYFNLLTTRFMASSLSNLVNNLSKEINRIKCKYEHDNKR